MNDEKRLEEIKKEDSKRKPFFYVILIIGCILGGITGYIVASKQEMIDVIFDFLRYNARISGVIFAALLIVFGLVMYIICLTRILSSKKLWAKEEERDDNWDKIERDLCVTNTLTSVSLIMIYFLYGCVTYNLKTTLSTVKEVSVIQIAFNTAFVAGLVFMILYMFLFFGIQRKIIEQEKIMNPEKKGSLYDFRFSKKWYESFDEAERKQVGIASFKAYGIVNYTCLATMVVLIFLGMVCEITIIPYLVVAVIWLTQIIAFGVENRKVMGKF
ncbi:MAG: DUF3169 family protein [Lachnospiraceae bacterium]|nr:DUF3169 family protein [Lachnospiraceae bacterium]